METVIEPNDLYKINKLNDFYNEYKINKTELTQSKHQYFRFICYKLIDFIKNIELPQIPIQSNYEAVLIEYRKFPHLEFLIRNAIYHLGPKWSHTVVCGTLNYDYICKMCNEISPNIKVIKTNYDNLMPSQYNKLLTSLNFWYLLQGEKILLYQEDSIIFKNNISDFLKWDYIGAPFSKHQNDTPNSVGNGGFSLRTRNIMIKVINTISVKNTVFEKSTLQYMKMFQLDYPPEDVYFSKNMQDLHLGIVADWDSAFEFSTESMANHNSFGGHKFWISDKNWKTRMKYFYYNMYKPKSDIKEYLKTYSIPLVNNKTSLIPNAFDVDLYFCNEVNKIFTFNEPNNPAQRKKIMNYVKTEAIKGKIYHPKQLYNVFSNIHIYSFLNNLMVEYKLNVYKINDFVEQYCYNITYEKLFQQLIQNKCDCLNKDISLLLLVFIGNETVGTDLFERIIKYKNIQKFNVAFCFNSETLYNNFYKKIANNLDYYSIYITKELGTDITPTLLMFDHISRKYNFEHIIKLHSKGIQNQYIELTDFLLRQPIDKLIIKKNKYCNCIGPKKYYIFLNEDLFNKLSLIENYSFMNTDFAFVGGTIFYCPGKIFKKVLEFVKTGNYNRFFLNNLYENNMINQDYSPIHFLERVFGIVKL